MSGVLVDTSVWIELFRRGRGAAGAGALERLLRDGLACTNGLIKAEVLSGAASDAELRELEAGLSALVFLPDPPGMWERVAQARYRLARRGWQAGIADLIVADSACRHDKALATLDRDFVRIRSVMPLRLLDVRA